MRHAMAGRKLNRTKAHREALLSNLAQNLIEHEQIKTTLPKAKELRRFVEPLITKATKGDLSARRLVAKHITNQEILKKLFDDVAPRFKGRPGGYTRVLKMGFRQGDAAPMALIELTAEAGEAWSAKPAPKKKAAPKAKKEEAPAAEAKAEETVTEEVKADAPEVVVEENTEAAAVEAKAEETTESTDEAKS